MFFKTRTNFFPKYVPEEKTLRIHKNSIVQKAVIEEADYTLLLDIWAFFRQGNYLDLTDKSNQYKKLVKFSLENDLIHQPTVIKESLSDFILDFLENTFDDYVSILEGLLSVKWELISAPEYVHAFFKEHGLIHESIAKKYTQRVIWMEGNKDIKLSLGDLCVVRQFGSYVLFFYTEKSDHKQAVLLLGKDDEQNTKLSIGEHILSMHLFLKYVNKLQNEAETDIMTRISENGQVNQINKQDIAGTYSQYERTFTKPYAENNLAYIQAVESKFRQFKTLSISINEEDGMYRNKLNIAQYEIKVEDDFIYTAFNYTYRDAATYALTHVLEKYLQRKANHRERWVAENTKERFYIRGMASFLKPDKAYRLTDIPQHIKNKITYITDFPEDIFAIHIVAHYLYKSYVFYLYLLDQDNHVLYKSDISTQLEEEINRGLAYITASVINQVERKKDIFPQPLSTLAYPETAVSDEVIYKEMIHDTRYLDVEEAAWAYQPEFERHGLFIGRFKMNGVT
ncbi:hypothetical protein J9303_01535 [Bacillaceae bacterium Marseille-Q3522]|nr:hypothetical protein [Bacillaceae bacterium Marseille-Q3522]